MANDHPREQLPAGSDETYLPRSEQERLGGLLRENTESSLCPTEERELARLIALHDECTFRRAQALADGVK